MPLSELSLRGCNNGVTVKRSIINDALKITLKMRIRGKIEKENIVKTIVVVNVVREPYRD